VTTLPEATRAVDHHRNCHHRMYRMGCAEFDALYADARGCCQICAVPEAETVRGKLVIDHLHGYGRFLVRGLLCDKCNKLMSRADSGERNPQTIAYCRQAWFSRP
jgi:hypothetical protein